MLIVTLSSEVYMNTNQHPIYTAGGKMTNESSGSYIKNWMGQTDPPSKLKRSKRRVYISLFGI